jgi:hypothetical protein
LLVDPEAGMFFLHLEIVDMLLCNGVPAEGMQLQQGIREKSI